MRWWNFSHIEARSQLRGGDLPQTLDLEAADHIRGWPGRE